MREFRDHFSQGFHSRRWRRWWPSDRPRVLLSPVVNVEDVFDEFSYGTHTPQAIRDFMALAKNSWAQGPGYLLLVGDASYDPRNYLGVGNFDFVPPNKSTPGPLAPRRHWKRLQTTG
jgi:hypothetical protein